MRTAQALCAIRRKQNASPQQKRAGCTSALERNFAIFLPDGTVNLSPWASDARQQVETHNGKRALQPNVPEHSALARVGRARQGERKVRESQEGGTRREGGVGCGAGHRPIPHVWET